MSFDIDYEGWRGGIGSPVPDFIPRLAHCSPMAALKFPEEPLSFFFFLPPHSVLETPLFQVTISGQAEMQRGQCSFCHSATEASPFFCLFFIDALSTFRDFSHVTICICVCKYNRYVYFFIFSVCFQQVYFIIIQWIFFRTF